MHWARRVATAGLATSAGMLILALALLTVLCLAEGGFRYSEVLAVASPDGRDCVTISKRCIFPLLDFTDPPILVRIALSGRSDRRRTVKLLEDSDLIEAPTVTWAADKVTVTGLSTREDTLVELARDR